MLLDVGGGRGGLKQCAEIALERCKFFFRSVSVFDWEFRFGFGRLFNEEGQTN